MKRKWLIGLAAVFLVLFGLGWYFGTPLAARELYIFDVYQDQNQVVVDVGTADSAVCVTGYRSRIEDRELILSIIGGLNRSRLTEVRIDADLSDFDRITITGLGTKTFSLDQFPQRGTP